MDLEPRQSEIWRYCCSLTKNPDAAMDLLQDVSLKCCQYASIHGDWPPTPYRLRMAKNQFTTSTKKQNRRRQEPLTGLEESSALSPELTVEHDEECQKLIDAVRKLPEPYQETARRICLWGQTNTQIATETGLPKNTVRTRRKRILDRLRNRFARDS